MLIPISSIRIGERQRTELDREAIANIKRSVQSNGLFNPITVEKIGDAYHLRAGENRLRACTELWKEGIGFYHGETEVKPNHIPAVIYSGLSELDAMTIELEENTIRSDLSWKDKTAALARIYELRKIAVPSSTQASVSEELAEKSGLSVSSLNRQIHQALIIEQYKDSPQVAKSRSMKEAARNATDIHNRRFSAELERRRRAKLEKEALASDLRLGDCISIMHSMDEGQFDMIICDPPYGYDAGTYFPNSTEVKHLYDDSPEVAEKIAKTILTEGFRLIKPKGGIVLFCKPTMFTFLHDFSKKMAWTPYPRPIIWDKMRGGSAPWGRLGPRNRYEMLFWCTKGQRGLVKQFDEIIEIPPLRERSHAAEKPIELMEFLVEHFTDLGENILDPCMGSGSTIAAAQRLGRKATGIEKVEEYYNMAVERLANLSKEKEAEGHE